MTIGGGGSDLYRSLAGDTVKTEILSGHGEHGAEVHRLGETAPEEKHRVSSCTVDYPAGGGGAKVYLWTRRTWC